ncbi:hypothetical protein ILUMI_15204 [Ignelater luminosus]|uniref:Gag protein n=1 Tax=Ignelater luminosus TaxID=2038154 RepID=A0A8K0G9B7_IGNLU|nr:hypothetical protein ILUMI_15204 [Ignelater luminosus]
MRVGVAVLLLAEEVIAIYGCDSWKKIKETLLQNFGDQRDENCLNQDLVNLKQKPGETPNQFHEKVMHLLNTICNYVDLHSEEPEKTRPIIRAMRPRTLVEAMQYINEEDNIKYYQKSNQIENKKPSQVHKTIHQFPQNHYYPGASQILNRPVTQIPQFRPSQFPQGPVNIQRNPNPARPTPMSISTRNTSHVKKPNPVNAFQNYGQKPRVISEKLFNTEFDDQSNNDLEYVYDNQQAYETCYVDDEHCEDSEYENFPQDPDINIPT